MLKWAVNQPRPSYLDGNSAPTPSATPTPLGGLKAKRRSLQPLGKENQLTSTSTPLPAASLTHRTPLLRDLSNIMSPLQMTTPTPPTAPRSHTRSHNRNRSQLKPSVYASTLPTFEAEYSPSYRTNEENDIIPGALLALRGMGIPDSYFGKPRYLEQKQIPSSSLATGHAPAVDAPTLSSSQMGDVTLERMIDAILESTRKPKAPAGVGGGRTRSRGASSRQRLRQRPQQRLLSTSVTHSPTYRPAFDPASDLCEYWQSSPAVASSNPPDPSDRDVYEEREVRSPQPGGGGVGVESVKRRSLQLRRQRVVRRKRKITTKISSSVRQSAQKLLAVASRSTQKLPTRVSSQSLARSRHISPDSGHNSTSECELEEELGLEMQLGVTVGLGLGLGDEQLEASCKLDAIWMHSEPRDVTKRRLSFSLNDDS